MVSMLMMWPGDKLCASPGKFLSRRARCHKTRELELGRTKSDARLTLPQSGLSTGFHTREKQLDVDYAGGSLIGLHLNPSRRCFAFLVDTEVDGSVRERELDSALVEALLHAAVELPAHAPLHAGDRLDLRP